MRVELWFRQLGDFHIVFVQEATIVQDDFYMDEGYARRIWRHLDPAWVREEGGKTYEGVDNIYFTDYHGDVIERWTLTRDGWQKGF